MLPLEVSVDVFVSMFPGQMDEDARAALPCLLPTEAAVTDATTRRTDPLLQHTTRCQHTPSCNTPLGVGTLPHHDVPEHINMPPGVSIYLITLGFDA